jgi:urease accessory protein
MSTASLLLLADGRFPSGGHAHSNGIEAACATGAVRDVASLGAFIDGRLATAGRVDAAFAAAAAASRRPWAELDRALDSRVLSPRQRSVSRALGRQLLRVGRQVWSDARLDALAGATPGGAHQAVVFGALASAASLTAHDAALCSLHHMASNLATSALRLLGLDPFRVHALLASFSSTIDALSVDAVTHHDRPLHLMPACSGPLAEILAEDHATWEVRLFAS